MSLLYIARVVSPAFLLNLVPRLVTVCFVRNLLFSKGRASKSLKKEGKNGNLAVEVENKKLRMFRGFFFQF